jgi:hypothetical protein
MKAGVEHEHVRRVLGELAQERLGVARRPPDVQAEVVEEPAEGLGKHGALVSDDYAQIGLFLPGRLHRSMHVRQQTGKFVGIFLSAHG